MPSVYREENFTGRVNFAAARISSGKRTTRHFDTCFEMNDGSEVAVALYRRSLKNPKIAANIWKYLAKDSVMASVEELKDVTNLPKRAAESRLKSKEAFAKTMASRDV